MAGDKEAAAQAREVRLAAALRENLKRRKAAASPAAEDAVRAPPGDGAPAGGAEDRGVRGAAGGVDEDR